MKSTIYFIIALCLIGGLFFLAYKYVYTDAQVEIESQDVMFGAISTNASEGEITPKQAKAIAAHSACIIQGQLTGKFSYDQATAIWSFALRPKVPQPGCSPICAVNEISRTASINWRCQAD